MKQFKLFQYICDARLIQNNEVHITNQTETKTKGRRTGASPAVQFILRMDKSCGDLPLLFTHRNARLMDKKKSFRLYLLEKTISKFESEKQVVIEQSEPGGLLFSDIVSRIRLTPGEFIQLLKDVHAMYDCVFPQEKAYHRKSVGEIRPYTMHWLRAEMNRLETAERYEDMEAVKYLMQILQKARQEAKYEA